MRLPDHELLEPFRARVPDVDLCDRHDAGTTAGLRRLRAQHGLLLFRDQALEGADIVRFSARFGWIRE